MKKIKRFISFLFHYLDLYFTPLPSICGGGCPRTQFEKNSSSKMAGKTINSENNHVDVMNKDAEICLNSDTLLPGNSVGGVFGRPGGRLSENSI